MKKERLVGYFCSTSAFTLIELLAVVLIIGILAAVALPQYQKAVEKSRAVQALTAVKSLAQAEEAYYLAHGEYTDQFDKLDIEFPPLSGGWRLSAASEFDDVVENDWGVSAYKRFGPADDVFAYVFTYYFSPKELACMCDRSECPLCASFPHTRADCHEADKHNDFICYYLN